MDKDLEDLLTSEFSDNHTPQEFRKLLMKFKYYYRLLYGQYQTKKNELENQIISLQKQNDKVLKKCDELENLNAYLSSELDKERNKTLFDKFKTMARSYFNIY
jgi:hypothetical protein